MALDDEDSPPCPGAPWILRQLPSCHGAFRQNTRVFLRKCGDEVNVAGLWPWRAWVVPLASDLVELKLQVYEEKFQHLSNVSCEQCRCNGWQHHPVSTRKYHLILPAPNDATLPVSMAQRGKTLEHPVQSLENKAHLLHGIIHCNGFGHLLRINGLEGGSPLLTGRQVMTLWDSLCDVLQARSISIEDVSNRKGMLLRVLTTVAEKRTWYGRWGYAFGRGGYNTSKAQWCRALEVTNRACLDRLIHDFEELDPSLVRIIERYRRVGDKEATTVGDWLAQVCELSKNEVEALKFAVAQASNQPQIGSPGSGPSVPRSWDCLERSIESLQKSAFVGLDPQGPPVSIPCFAPETAGGIFPGPSGPSTETRHGPKRWGGWGVALAKSPGLSGDGCLAVGLPEVKVEEGLNNFSRIKTDEPGRGASEPRRNWWRPNPRSDMGAIPSDPVSGSPLPTGANACCPSQEEARRSGDFLMLSRQVAEGNGRPLEAAPKKSIKRKFEMEDASLATPPELACNNRCPQGANGDSGGSTTIRNARKKAPSEPPVDLIKPKIKPFNPQALLEGPRMYSASKLSEFMRIVLGVIQTVEGRWVRLQELRENLYSTAHDRVLADWVLGRISNTLFSGFIIYKTRSKIGRCNYFLFQKMELEEVSAMGGPDPLSMMVEETLEVAPGPGAVAGNSLDRFEQFLSRLYVWLCAQPGVVVGRGPNKKKVKENCPPSEPKKKTWALLREDSANKEAQVVEREGVPADDSPCITSHPRRKRSSRGAASVAHAAEQNKRLKMDAMADPRRKQANGIPEVVDPWLHQYVSTVALSMQMNARKGPVPGAPFTAKNQVLADLLYFYQNVLEVYKPALQGPNGYRRLFLKEFPQSVQVLKDTKLFVKNYDRLWMKRPLPGAADGGKFIRLMCRVELEPTIPPDHPHRMNDGTYMKPPSFFRRLPPAEPVLVSDKMPLHEITQEILRTFRNVYGMFQNWRITNIDGLRFSSEGRLLMPPPEIRVRGCNYRPELELRHAGGIEDWEVFCRCRAEDDDGARMVACDQCGLWMHTRCMGFRDDEEVPEYFKCLTCVDSNQGATSKAGTSNGH
ncbi:hypothetical protein BSKO_10248 [Bryopsis sp. KO-2023]|nr:hypothetical protein BSKO_10248 [Bryopsis sp. KO-2023]